MKKSNRQRSGSRLLLAITCAVLTTLVVALVIAIQGNVRGTEFSPTHFQTRRFSFYEIPFVHVQITPIHRKNTTGPLARQLRTKGWIRVPRGTTADRWHLVELTRGPSTTPGDAALLTSEMGLQGSQGLFWKAWNREFPQRAAVLWPTVQRLAERELYLIVPQLMQLARSLSGADEAAALRQVIDRWLVGQYAALVADLRAAGRPALAEELLDEARGDYPEAQVLAELTVTEG